MLDVHEGKYHVDFFQSQFPQLIAKLPPRAFALELGAGMAWHSALLAAHSDARVLAVEPAWATSTPYNHNNVYFFKRLSASQPELQRLLTFEEDAHGEPRSVCFGERLQLAVASAGALPVQSAVADLVFSYNVVEHLPDLHAAFAEAARVLKPGGYLFGSTEPLFFSSQGNHLQDMFYLPWGHLLWEPEEFLSLVHREAGEDREIEPGRSLSVEFLRDILYNQLNYATPSSIRRTLRNGPWNVAGWVDVADPAEDALARQLGIYSAVKAPREALLLKGLRFLLQRTEKPRALRPPLQFSFLTRRKLRLARNWH